MANSERIAIFRYSTFALRYSILFIALFFIAFSAHAADPPPVADIDAFLAELERGMEGAKTVLSEYRQERVLSLFDEPLVTSGIMLFERPARVRWETAEPYQSLLLADAKAVAQFEWIDGKRKKMNLGYPEGLRRMMDEIAAMNQGRMRERAAHYDVQAFKGQSARIVMSPKDAALREFISAIEIDMKPDFSATESITLREPNGDLTRIVILSERRNVPIPARAFDLADPLELEKLRAALGAAAPEAAKP